MNPKSEYQQNRNERRRLNAEKKRQQRYLTDPEYKAKVDRKKEFEGLTKKERKRLSRKRYAETHKDETSQSKKIYRLTHTLTDQQKARKKESDIVWKINNRQHLLEYAREYHNLPHVKEADRIRRRNIPIEVRRERRRIYLSKRSPEQIERDNQRCREWRAIHKLDVLKQHRERWRNDPAYREKVLLYSRNSPLKPEWDKKRRERAFVKYWTDDTYRAKHNYQTYVSAQKRKGTLLSLQLIQMTEILKKKGKKINGKDSVRSTKSQKVHTCHN